MLASRIYGYRDVGDMALFNTWTANDIEHGKTAATIRAAFDDNSIDQKELDSIRAEMFVDFGCELELLDRLRQYAVDDASLSIEPPPPLAEAIRKTILGYPGGVSHLAAKMQMREIELSKKTKSGEGDANLTLKQALALMLHTDNYDILHAIAAPLDYTCIAIPRYEGVNDMALLDAWSSWNVERGDTVALIHSALEDGSINHSELKKIEKEMFEDFNKELALLARLQTMLS